MFAQLFKSAISNFNTVVKTMDSKLDAFVLSVAKQLDVENEKVKVAVLEAFKLLEDDAQRRLEQEKLEKQQKQEQLKKEREEKKAKEEAEKADRAAKRAEEARVRAEKKAAEEEEKAKKAAEKEAEKLKKAEEKAKKEAEKLAEKVEVHCEQNGCGKKIKKGKDFYGSTVCADYHLCALRFCQHRFHRHTDRWNQPIGTNPKKKPDRIGR
jgi:chemotaxis protein histidine kinase CheA